MAKKWLNTLAEWLVLIGALNWGLTALGFNLVTTLANTLNFSWLESTVYYLVGASAVWLLIKKFK